MDYFLGNRQLCEGCSRSIDVWQSLKFAFQNQVPVLVLGLGGAANLTFNVELNPGDQVLVDLTAAGLPSDVSVVSRQYSTANGYRPIEVTDLHHPGSRHLPARYGLIALADIEQSAEAPDMLMQVMFVPTEIYSQPGGLFMLACELFIANEPLGQAAVLAHSAVEGAIREAIKEYFARGVASGALSEKLAERFDVKLATQVMMPTIAENFGFRQLPQHILGELEELRKVRNDAAHTSTAPNFSAVALEFAAATVALAWFEILRMIMSGAISYIPPTS